MTFRFAWSTERGKSLNKSVAFQVCESETSVLPHPRQGTAASTDAILCEGTACIRKIALRLGEIVGLVYSSCRKRFQRRLLGLQQPAAVLLPFRNTAPVRSTASYGSCT